MKKTEEILVAAGLDQAALSVSPSAFETRDELALEAAAIGVITTQEEANKAADCLKRISAFLSAIEASRVDVKAPVLDLGKRIDALAKELTVFLEEKKRAVSRLLGTYQEEQRRLADEAARKAREEEQRILREAEQKKMDAELAVSMGESPAGRLEKKLDRIDAKAFEQVAVTRANVPTYQPAAGTATRTLVEFEVEDIAALYAARPDLVKLEPNKAAIKAIITANSGIVLPGVRHWRSAATVVR